MNIYLHELKSLRKSAILWTCSMIALMALYFSFYPGIVQDAAEFKKLLSAYPPAFQKILGFSIDSITSVLGFYAMTFSFITLLGAIQAMNTGMSVLSKESRERTADFLLVKPVSRSTIVTAKLLAALTIIFATNILYYAASLIMVNMVQNSGYNNKLFLMMTLTLLFIQLIFLALGLFLSVFFTKLKSVLPISLGVVFGLYFIGALVATGKNDAARFISPFKYFDLSYIIKNGSYEIPYLITGAIIVLLAITAGYVIYQRKDIHAV